MNLTTSVLATTTAADGAATVGRLLDAIAGGAGVPGRLLSPDVVLDATVPGWRFTVRGAERVAAQYSGWFEHPATYEELERLVVPGGEVVTYLLAWEEAGVPHAGHHCHVIRFDAEGRIANDRFFCGGRWDAARLAEMAEASDD